MNKISSNEAYKIQSKGAMSNSATNFAMECCSMTSIDDRVAYLRYYFTKALYEDSTTVLGSLVMNSENSELGIKQLYANCTEAAPFSIHMDVDPNFKKDLGVMGRIKDYFETKIEKYMACIRSGALVFKPKLGNLSPENSSLINEVASLKPYVISWSNVPDYMKPSTFHEIAKRMSCDETAHYMHSCNWVDRVLGTDIYDFTVNSRLHYYAAGMFTIERSLSMLDGFTGQGAYHFRDICTVALGRRYVKNFFRYFFEGQEVNCSCLNGKNPVEVPLSTRPRSRHCLRYFRVQRYWHHLWGRQLRFPI